MNLREVIDFYMSAAYIEEMKRTSAEIKGDDLYRLRYELQDCDEFKGTSLHFIPTPLVLCGDSYKEARSIKLPDNYKFTGENLLYSIMFTPAIYDPVTFIPTRGLILRGVFNQKIDTPVIKQEIEMDINTWYNKWTRL